MFAIQYICSHIEVPVHVGKRFRSIKESITQLSQNSNEMNNDTLNTRTRGTLLQRSTLQPRISVDIKRKRKRSDSVLWQKPLHQQKCQKGKVTTQTTPQKSSIKQRLRTDLGRSVGVTKATQLVWLTGLRAHLPTNRNSRLIKRTHV